MYAPQLGRFISRDPEGYIDGANQYEFVADNPVALTDPFGLQSELLTTQPSTVASTQPANPISTIIGPNLFQVTYNGSGRVTFKQTVEITPCGCYEIPDAVRAKEKSDHGGADPFNGPVGDNDSGDANKPYGGKGHRFNGGDRLNQNQMTDYPGFPDPYPPRWCGTKSFVTTVTDATGIVISTIKWSVSQDGNGNVSYKNDQ